MQTSRNELMLKNLKLNPTDVAGSCSIELPPPGFDPKKADTRTLLRYGIPPRPDEKVNPSAAKAWDRLAHKGMRVTEPELIRRPEVKGSPRPELRKRTKGTADNATSSNWSGGVLTSGGPYTSIFGGWTVPSVAPGGAGDGDWWSVAWVGLDGDGTTDLVQAGTAQHVNVTNGQVTTEYFGWYEWVPNNWTSLSQQSFPVNPGDTVFFVVDYLGVNNGTPQARAQFTNSTQNVTTFVVFDAPAGSTFQGNTAEWIMERPEINGSLSSLARYGNISFYSMSACGTGIYEDGTTATGFTMVGATGTNLSTAQLESEWDCAFDAAS